MLKALNRAESAGIVFLTVLLLVYGVIPLGFHLLLENTYALQFAVITLIGSLAFFLGWQLRVRVRMPIVVLDLNQFFILLWVPFMVFVVVAWISAERIPLIAALGGADADTIAVLREKFLKAREGWQSSFVYINAILTGALIPYSIALAFYHRHRFRWTLFLFFLFYCFSFMEKAYFSKAMIPLIYLVMQDKIKLKIKPVQLLLITLGLLYLISFVAGSGKEVTQLEGGDDFFSATYVPTSPLQHLVWRTVAVPVLTAIDSIRTFYESFGGHFFKGATSSLFTGLFGMKYVEFERAVFSAQWGQNETGTGSSNAVYLIEAFVNWGYAGVISISCMAGALLRFMAVSNDEPLKALWILFGMGLFTSGFVGLMFSNGFLLLFLVAFFVKLRKSRSGQHSATDPGILGGVCPTPKS